MYRVCTYIRTHSYVYVRSYPDAIVFEQTNVGWSVIASRAETKKQIFVSIQSFWWYLLRNQILIT